MFCDFLYGKKEIECWLHGLFMSIGTSWEKFTQKENALTLCSCISFKGKGRILRWSRLHPELWQQKNNKTVKRRIEARIL